MVKYFEIGQITNTHGLKGELKVRPFTSDIKKFERLKTILIDIKDEKKKFQIESVRYQKDIILLKLKNVDNIDDAEKFKNKSIEILREDADKLEEGEYFISDLLGIEVFEKNILIGNIDDVFSTGSTDVYVIKRKNKKDLLIPAIEANIKNVDIEGRRIDVEIPRGLDDEV